jgi:sugar phosphate isomerase/epimerase
MNNPVLISTAVFDGYNLSTAIREIAAVGADGVEIAFIEGYTEPFTEEDFNQEHADAILSQLRKYNIPCRSFSAHMDLTKEHGVEIFTKRMLFARMLGADTIISNAAPVDRKNEFLLNIIPLSQTAKSIGITIALENPGDGKANVIDTAQQAGPFFDAIALEAVGLNYDFGNLISHCFEKVSPEKDYLYARTQTCHYHIKDVDRRGDGWGFTAIGAGIIDYHQILSSIGRDPRPLPVSLEIPLRLQRASDASPIRAVQRIDLGYINTILEQSIAFVRKKLAN